MKTVSKRTLANRLRVTAKQEFAAWDGRVEDDNCVPDGNRYRRELAPLLRLCMVFMYRDKAQMVDACRGLDQQPREGGGTMLDAVQADIDHVSEFVDAMKLLTEGAKARLLVACAAIAVERGVEP
ncbi:MAG: hypothetical protein ABL879_18105 [Devosia sp.]